MDIIIKSFNRPYYLDRCIESIYLNCTRGDFKIIVLDDGTPENYLRKIQNKFPEISILKSNFYEYKTHNLNNAMEEMIPIDFWVDSVRNVSDYFLLLEDDFWLIEPLHLKELETELYNDAVVFLKLFWLGNPKLRSVQSVKKNSHYSIIKPNLLSKNPRMYHWLFHKKRFKLKRIFHRLKITSHDKSLQYYHIYSVAGAVFHKDYFVSLWKHHTQKVNEALQIFNALQYLKQHPKSAIAHSNKEYLQTGFMTSATSSYKDFEGIHLDVFECNKLLNEAWYNDDWDVMKNYPKDLDANAIMEILSHSTENHSISTEWEKWMNVFKNKYISFGCKVE